MYVFPYIDFIDYFEKCTILNYIWHFGSRFNITTFIPLDRSIFEASNPVSLYSTSDEECFTLKRAKSLWCPSLWTKITFFVLCIFHNKLSLKIKYYYPLYKFSLLKLNSFLSNSEEVIFLSLLFFCREIFYYCSKI